MRSPVLRVMIMLHLSYCYRAMPDHFKYDIFLSHNNADKPRVRQLAERLQAAGVRVWFDDWVIKPGDNIYLAVERGLEAARVQLLCLSQTALGSEWVMLERSTVLFRDPSNKSRQFIPLLLENCDLPDTLRCYKYVDFREESDEAFAEVLAICRLKMQSSSFQESGPDSVLVHKPSFVPPTQSRDDNTTCSPSVGINTKMLNRLPAALFEELVFKFDSYNAVPGREAAQAIRAIELIRIVEATGQVAELHQEIGKLGGHHT